MREKLIELIGQVQDYGFGRATKEEPQCRVINCIVADYLIANGVMMKSDCEDCASKTTRIIDKLHGENAKLREIQRWIPVTERLPTAEDALLNGSVYVYTKAKKVLILHCEDACKYSNYILYWMATSMPKPPKGE